MSFYTNLEKKINNNIGLEIYLVSSTLFLAAKSRATQFNFRLFAVCCHAATSEIKRPKTWSPQGITTTHWCMFVFGKQPFQPHWQPEYSVKLWVHNLHV